MNKKNKGFTTIELITSFTLASVIMIILFNIILILKDNLSEVNAKTNMLVNKDNLSYNINKRFKEKELSSITMCEEGDKCYEFKYSDDTSDKLVYSNTDKSITFNNYTFDIIDGITVEEPTITEHYDTMSSTKYNGYFIIHIPIKLDDKDYSIKVNKHFNTDSLVMDIGNYWDNNGNRYTIVDYLESTGTQYIDTGFIFVGTKCEIYTDFVITQFSNGWNNISATQKDGSTRFGSIQFYNRINYFTIGSTPASDGINFGITLENTRYQIEMIVDTKIGNMIVNRSDNKTGKLNIRGSVKTGLSIYIFNKNPNYPNPEAINAKIYNYKIVEDDTLVRDYIPVIDSSSRPCLFDKVEKKCYYNQGTGEFLYG